MDKYPSQNQPFTKLLISQPIIETPLHGIEVIHEQEHEESHRNSLMPPQDHQINIQVYQQMITADQVNRIKRNKQQSWKNIVELKSPSQHINKTIPITHKQVMKKLQFKAEQQETAQSNKRALDPKLRRILRTRPISLRKADFKFTRPVEFKLSKSNWIQRTKQEPTKQQPQNRNDFKKEMSQHKGRLDEIMRARQIHRDKVMASKQEREKRVLRERLVRQAQRLIRSCYK